MITYALKKLLESRGLSSAGIKDIADAIERLTDDSYIRETLAKLIANLADGYSEEDTYPIGDYVFYEDVLYKCVEPVTVGEPFDPDKWVKTTIEEMFINADVSSAVAALANDIAPMYDPTQAYTMGDYIIYQFGLYQKTSGSAVAENWNPSHWTPVRINEIIERLREELSNDILNVKITYDPSTERATSDVAGTVINNAITNGKTVAAYVNNVPAAVTKSGTGNSYTLSFDAQRVSSYGADEVVLEDILVRYINVTGQWTATVTYKTLPLNGGDSDFYTVTMSYDDTNELWTCDKTYSELQKFEGDYSGSDHKDAPLIKVVVDTDTEDDWEMSAFGNLVFAGGDPIITAFSYNGGDEVGIYYQKFVINSDESVDYSTGYSGDSSSDSNVLIIPLTFVAGGQEDMTQREAYRGEWDENTTYDFDDIVKATVYDENTDVANYDNYVGVYDPTASYNEDNIVYYKEDVTQRTEYNGTWDATVTYNYGDIVTYDGAYWVCSAMTSLNDTPDSYNDWNDFSPQEFYFKSKVSSNTGNDPRSDYEGSGDYWESFYWDEYEPNLYGKDRLKGEWNSSSTYSYGDIVWKLDDNNRKIYYTLQEEIAFNFDPEDGYPWEKIGPIKTETYYESVSYDNLGNDPRQSLGYWNENAGETLVDRYTSDVTVREIIDAVNDNKLVVGVYRNNDGDLFTNYIFNLTLAIRDDLLVVDDPDPFLYRFMFERCNPLGVQEIWVHGSTGDINNEESTTLELYKENNEDTSSALVIELTYNEGEEEDVTEKNEYRGEWDPTGNTYAYDEGDIVHYSEDVTQKSNYYGEYDPSIVSYDNIGYSDPIVYFPEDNAYFYVEWNGESSWLGDEYTPVTGYFYVNVTEVDDGGGESHNEYSLGDQYTPEVGKDYYSTSVTKDDIRSALKEGKTVIAVRYGDLEFGGFYQDDIYTLVNNSFVAGGEMLMTDTLTRFVGFDRQSGNMVFLESTLQSGSDYIDLYIKENSENSDTTFGDVTLSGDLTLGYGTEDEVTITAAQLKALLALLNT